MRDSKAGAASRTAFGLWIRQCHPGAGPTTTEGQPGDGGRIRAGRPSRFFIVPMIPSVPQWGSGGYVAHRLEEELGRGLIRDNRVLHRRELAPWLGFRQPGGPRAPRSTYHPGRRA